MGSERIDLMVEETEEKLRQDVLGGNGARTGMQHKKEREWSCKKTDGVVVGG